MFSGMNLHRVVSCVVNRLYGSAVHAPIFYSIGALVALLEFGLFRIGSIPAETVGFVQKTRNDMGYLYHTFNPSRYLRRVGVRVVWTPA